MYEQQFGLKKRPFLAKAMGNNVFVGPQTAKTMTGLKKALMSQDAVVAVSGPPGAGKTTLVAKSLDALCGTHTTVHIGRMHLEGTDVLEFLLEELGTTELPRGTIRQFTALREQLRQLEAEGKHVVIAVEDAIRTGAETLAELEALTAADAGESGGAAIVLMGDGGLLEFLKEPQLVRLNQRIRQRHAIEPLRAAELRGYLMHCFRLAGNDFEQVFDGRTADLIHELSGGIPRVANNLVESAMSSAATAEMERIPALFVAKVAKEEFGLEATEFDATPPPAAPEPATKSVVMPVVDPHPGLVADLEELSKPSAEQATVTTEAGEDDIPELIHDTLPDLQMLAPDVIAAAAEGELPVLTPEPAPEPVLKNDPGHVKPLMNESSAAEIPEWERDPTIAELRPDLDALEKAMAFAQGPSTSEPEAEASFAVEPQKPMVEPAPDEIPEITLDNAIQLRIENELIDEPGQISPNAPEAIEESTADSGIPEVNIAPRKAKKADAELERIAVELARAKSIEEVDGKLAETLFGEELNLVAAQVVASPTASRESANDDELALFDTVAAQMAQAAGVPAVEISLETPEQGGEAGLDISASQRLKLARALNVDLHPSIQEPEDTPPSATNNEPSSSFETPAPIEDQINTTMTQTLKALNVKPPISERVARDAEFDDEELEPKKNGFFSRFKRS